MINDKTLVVDSCVGLKALTLMIKNSNMPVGMVTVRHQVFSELIVQVRTVADEKAALSDSINVFRLCFGNRHTIKEGKGKKIYESPLLGTDQDGNPYHYTTGDNIECMKISPRLADMIYQEVQVMEINAANVIAACQDLIVCGRMFQELTIDSAKTMYDVNIPYGEDMIHCHLNSNDNDENNFHARINWQILSDDEQARQIARRNRAEQMTGLNRNTARRKKIHKDIIEYVANADTSQIVTKKFGDKFIKVLNVKDFLSTVRQDTLTCVLDAICDCAVIKQEFNKQVLTDINNIKLRPNCKKMSEIIRFCHDLYRSVMSYQSYALAQIRKEYDEKTAIREHSKEVKADARKAMKAIANMIRIQAKKMNLKEHELILLAIGYVISEGKNSSFAHSLLEEEFFQFAFSLFDADSCPKRTVDRLDTCSFEEGDVVTFCAGIAQDGNKEAIAMSNLDGKFVIERNDQGNLVATSSILDLIQDPVVDHSQLIFSTKPGGGKDNSFTCRNIDKITQRMLQPNTKVTLVPFIKGNDDVHDAIVIDGVIVGMFRCSFSVANKAVNSVPVTSMYQNKEGIVDHVIVTNAEGRNGNVALVVLRDVKTVNTPDIIGNWIKESQPKPVQLKMPDPDDLISAIKRRLGQAF